MLVIVTKRYHYFTIYKFIRPRMRLHSMGDLPTNCSPILGCHLVRNLVDAYSILSCLLLMSNKVPMCAQTHLVTI